MTGPIKAFSDHIVYKPVGGEARVKAGRSTIYNTPGDQAFFAALDIYLVEATWVQLMSWENDTDAAQVYQQEYKTELKVIQGTEVSVSVSIGASFKALEMSMDSSVKVFSSTETTSSSTKTTTVNVPARSKLVFYQRQYKFRVPMFFILDAWGQEWNAGSWGGYDLTRAECQVTIMSEDYLTTDKELNNTSAGTMRVSTVGPVQSAGTTRKRENLTGRAKDSLSSMGL